MFVFSRRSTAFRMSFVEHRCVGSFWLMKQSRYSPPIWGQGASRQRPIPLVRCGIWVASEVIASDTLADGDKQMWNVSITALGVGLVEACTL